LTARVARALDDGEPLALPPNRLIEENLWRATRYGLAGELIDLETERVLPARERLAELVDWMLPVAAELGVADALTVPSANAAERQIARYEMGESLTEIYEHEVLEPVRV
jgi:carboxylate-amine ligase